MGGLALIAVLLFAVEAPPIKKKRKSAAKKSKKKSKKTPASPKGKKKGAVKSKTKRKRTKKMHRQVNVDHEVEVVHNVHVRHKLRLGGAAPVAWSPPEDALKESVEQVMQDLLTASVVPLVKPGAKPDAKSPEAPAGDHKEGEGSTEKAASSEKKPDPHG